MMRKMMQRSVVLLHCCYSWMMVPCSGRSSLRTESRRDIQDIIKTKLPTINEDSTELCFSAAASSSLHQNHHKSKNHRKRQQGQEQGILQHQVEMMIMRTTSSSTGAAAAAAANTNKGIKSSTSTTGGGRPHQSRRPFSLTDYYVHFILRFASRAARF